jgi:hypothetical protein
VRNARVRRRPHARSYMQVPRGGGSSPRRPWPTRGTSRGAAAERGGEEPHSWAAWLHRVASKCGGCRRWSAYRVCCGLHGLLMQLGYYIGHQPDMASCWHEQTFMRCNDSAFACERTCGMHVFLFCMRVRGAFCMEILAGVLPVGLKLGMPCSPRSIAAQCHCVHWQLLPRAFQLV